MEGEFIRDAFHEVVASFGREPGIRLIPGRQEKVKESDPDARRSPVEIFPVFDLALLRKFGKSNSEGGRSRGSDQTLSSADCES